MGVDRQAELLARAGSAGLRRSHLGAWLIGALMLITVLATLTVMRSLGAIEEDLPRFSFFAAMEMSATRRDVAALQHGLDLALHSRSAAVARERLGEAADLVHIRLNGMEDSWLSDYLPDYRAWRRQVRSILDEVDAVLAEPRGIEDLSRLEPLIGQLEQKLRDIDTTYHRFGAETNLALDGRRSQLRHLESLLAGLLGLLAATMAGTSWLIVKLRRSVERQARAEEQATAERLRIEGAIEGLSDGFAYFDADDRLALCNSRYRSLYPLSAELMQPGISFEELIRGGLVRGEYVLDGASIEEAVRRRIETHQAADGRVIEQQLADGSVLRISERRMPDGGIAGIRSDITELKMREQALAASERRYRHLASYDTLTGLSNRSLFGDTLDYMLETSSIADCCTIVLLLDIDRFKEINEIFGHQTGDLVLQTVADRLASIMPDGGIAARIGADEFALVVSAVTGNGVAQKLAERIIETFQNELVLEQQRLIVRVTIGIAVHPDHAETAEDLLRRADLALYRAKQVRRGGYVMYDPEMSIARARRRTVEQSLKRALRDGELSLAVQPKLCLAEAKIKGVELLLRWYDPVRGENVEPGEFIPIAENSAIILDIDRYVLKEGCRRAVAWKTEHGLDLQVSINLSGAHFRRPELPNLIAQTLASTGLEPRLLEIEMTEGVLVQDRKMSEGIIHQLHEMGVKIALDDFGTGYSSLAYLRDLPLDRLKIDRSFVIGLEQSPRNRAIVKTFITLGHELGMSIIAEGVQTQAQLRFLQSIGCDDIQGYLLARPLPERELAGWLADESWRSCLDPASAGELACL